MNIKTLAAVVYSERDAQRTFRSALDLATRNSVHLIALHSEYTAAQPVGPMGTPDPGFIQTEIDIARQRSQSLKTLFDKSLGGHGAAAEWRSVSGYAPEGETVVRAARACDMVVVQQRDPDDPTPRDPDIHTILFEAGRPVLVIPYAVNVDMGFKRILLAWNGTRESARAAFDALPFMRGAENVDILCLDPHDTEEADFAVSGADIAEALARHGATVTLAARRSGGVPPGESIENALAENRADLLVMGAFSQHWLKQFFFGGATRTLLKSMPTATLMSR